MLEGFLNQVPSISLLEGAMRLFLAGFIGFAIGIVYSFVTEKLNYSSTLRNSICLISVIIAGVMIAISSNIPYLLGLLVLSPSFAAQSLKTMKWFIFFGQLA